MRKLLRGERFGPWLGAVAIVAGLIVWGLTLSYTFDRQKSTAEAICESAVENRRAVRLTWDAARDLVLSGETDEERIDRTNAFFNNVLSQVPPIRCEGSEPVEVP